MSELKKNVVLVDNHPVVIDALQNRLNQTQEFNVVASVNHSDKAFFEVMERVPDVVIMEIELPGRGATAVAEQIIQRLPTTKIVFFTSYDSDVYIDFALKIGVAGYVLKSESLDMFVSGLKTVCKGEKYYSNEVLDRLEYDTDSNEYCVKTQSYLSTLTLRQLQVLRHLVRGESVKEVASTMTLSERAIESHKYRIMQKLGIHDRVELARFAIREGLMPA